MKAACCAGWRPSAARSSPRSTAPRSAAAWRSRWPATTASPWTSRASKIGLPEVTLGLLPGGGGVVRTVRMFGIQTALMKHLLQGQQRKPKDALEAGLVDEVVDTPEEMIARGQDVGRCPTSTPCSRGTSRATRSPAARRRPRRSRRTCRRSRRTCASSSRAPRCPRRTTSWPRPWRVPRSTSTPPSRSRRSTSSTSPPARSART